MTKKKIEKKKPRGEIKPHLTLDDRIEIQKGLDYGVPFKAIGKKINFHPTTVSREVGRYLTIKPSSITRKDADGNVLSNICPNLKNEG